MAKKPHPLLPDETIHKILISTTSRLIGDFTSEDLVITHAWPQFSGASGFMRTEESPVSRSGFVVAFQTEPYAKEVGVAIPDYSPVGEIVCSYLSVLFGKRFDCHGLIEGSGFYNTPDLSVYNSICNPKFEFNSHEERKCFRVPLNLENYSCLAKILTGCDVSKEIITKLNAACKFYMQALQNVEHEPEVAYLHLITAGEILAGAYQFEKEEILDQEMLKVLSTIENELEGGRKLARQIEKRLLGVKRTFVKALCSLIDDDFFCQTKLESEISTFTQENIEQCIGAAYDLRSKYVHTGSPFGIWIKPKGHGSDLQFGRPVVSDTGFGKILARAPTFQGLERFIRYCLLKFMMQNGFPDLGNCRINA
ncbi:HEPN domain-containing protein [Vibrio parahaemolyticus]|uniref:HEPN domain-containing protein n=1 Tax=Vibrio parahaemolyticus TaxID=670 RepID=UPI0004D96D6F|nr:HEPN domain-containing protein [Vibrio parahaemolyticus]EKB1992660.1 hypothetical protein [Vibrio parahaemolyticus]EME0136156.1 hypothetical protein [Vibrio parahaemolyticus]OAR42242.1 hypothetical protein EM55_023940 [Vibrio parahaemolyticus]HCZ9717100.1 hypothetical protein [Vibrio parahaemolyticus]